MRVLVRMASRCCLSGIFLFSGYRMINNAEQYARQASTAFPLIPEEPMLAKAHGATMLVAGSTFALGILPRLSARILALTLITNTAIGHPFWKAKTADERRPQLIHFLKNLAVFGGLVFYTSAERRSKAD